MSRRPRSSRSHRSSAGRRGRPSRARSGHNHASRYRRQSRADYKQAREKKIAIAIFGMVTLFVLAFVAYSLTRPPTIEVTADLCPKDSAQMTGHTIILIDATDNLSNDESNLRKMLDAFINERLQKNERLSLSVLGGVNYDIQERISLCRPLHPDDGNALTQSMRDLSRTFNDKFNAPLTKELDRLADIEASNSSPLIEALGKVSGNYDFVKRRSGKRIIFVSDMLQNTNGLNQFRNKPTFAAFKQSQYYQTIKPDLQNTDIVIFYVKRPQWGAHQTRQHREFWRDLLEDSGARSITYDPPVLD